MKSLIITVDVIAGTDRAEAASQIAGLALKLDLMVKADFNGVEMCAYPGNSAERVLSDFVFEWNRKFNSKPRTTRPAKTRKANLGGDGREPARKDEV